MFSPLLGMMEIRKEVAGLISMEGRIYVALGNDEVTYHWKRKEREGLSLVVEYTVVFSNFVKYLAKAIQLDHGS